MVEAAELIGPGFARQMCVWRSRERIHGHFDRNTAPNCVAGRTLGNLTGDS